MRMMRAIVPISILMLAECAIAGARDTNFWTSIPFLSNTNTVEQLNKKLNDHALPPGEKFSALCALFVTYVPAGATSSMLTNTVGRAPDWLAGAELAGYQSRGKAANCAITFTNDLSSWENRPANPGETDKPRLMLWLTKSPRYRQHAVQFFTGQFPARIEKFMFYTWHEGLWVIFLRYPHEDRLQIWYPNRKHVFLKRKPVFEKVQQDAPSLRR